MALFTAIQRAGALYPYYDYAHGYGMPQADAMLQPSAGQRPSLGPTVSFVASDSVVSVFIRPEAAPPVVARALPLYLDSVATAADAPARVGALGREEARPSTASEGVGASGLPASAAPVLPAAGYFFWHVADAHGVLHRYEVLEVRQRAILRIPRRTLRPGDVIRVFYLGATHSYPIL
jgi:serine protease AprX